MRKTLLASATLFGLAFMPAAFAQTATPDQSAPPAATAPDAGTANDTTPPAGAGMNATTPPKHHHHHHVAKTDDADSADTKFAHEPGTGESGPASARASNIDSSDSHSEIAPHLPAPNGGMNAGPWHYLHDAQHALAMHQTGKAQQALEMAETRLLDRSTPATDANQPDQGPVIQQVTQARQALGHGDMAGARSAIQMALAHDPHTDENGAGGMGMNNGAMHGGSGMSPGASNTGMSQPGMAQPGMAQPGMTQPGMAQPGMATNQPGGAPNGNGTPTSPTMSPTGAGPQPGASAGASAGGGPAGTGTADSAGGAK